MSIDRSAFFSPVTDSAPADSAVAVGAAGASGARADAGCWRRAALEALRECEPLAKVDAVRSLYARAATADGQRDGAWDPERAFEAPANLPGRPARPELVEPRGLERRSMSTPQGRVVLLHALAHIEFNAINLALDAVWRFARMPETFYADWLKVAAEEAYHFSLLCERLVDYGHAYGDFPAHNGLW
ncbi:MAG TPA: ferritin-like domain-containing protein, partial [Paraburkholderia sp.]